MTTAGVSFSARSANVSGAERARAAVGQASETARIAMPERRPNAPDRGGRRRDSWGCGVEIGFLFNVPVLLVAPLLFRRRRIKDRAEYGANLTEMGLPVARFKAISWRAAPTA